MVWIITVLKIKIYTDDQGIKYIPHSNNYKSLGMIFLKLKENIIIRAPFQWVVHRETC